MLRIDSDAVVLPAACLAQSTPARSAEDGDHSSCLPFMRRKAPPCRPRPGGADADVARLSLARLVGADLDDGDARSVRVYFTEEEQQDKQRQQHPPLRGYVCPPPLRVRVSVPIPIDNGGAGGDDPAAVVARLRAAARSSAPPPARFLAIVNPASGRGRAMREFERDARPVLERAAGIDLSSGDAVRLTRYAGHAREIAAREPLLMSTPLSHPGAAVVLAVVGGDGTLHEVLNGLLSRLDWRECARRVALAHFPCGSGNGVAVSCGLRDAATAAVAVAKGAVAPLDVTSVLIRRQQQPTVADSAAAAAATAAGRPATWTRTFIALSLVYGMMANLDVRTEPLRWMGDARFTLGGAAEILAARSYACRGAFCSAGRQAGDGGSFLDEEEDVGGGRGAGGWTQQQQQLGASLLAGARSRSCDLLAAGRGGGREASDAGAPGGDNVLSDGGPPLPLLAQLLLPLSQPALPERVPPADALPPGWRPLPLGGGGGEDGSGGGGGGAHLWAAVGPTYVAANYRFNPLGGLSTGVLRQMWVPADAVRGWRGRLASLAMQDAAAEGRHLENEGKGGAAAAGGLPTMRHAPAAALAFEPTGAAAGGGTYLQLDGEVVRGMSPPGGAVYAEVHRGLLRCVVRPGHPETVVAATASGRRT
jgi:sphingosine kinase